MTIPDWDVEGVLPPFDASAPTSRSGRSPFDATLVELVERFATSEERIDILRGLLEFRASLHRLGYVAGFQWIDGSFSEDVERIEARPPRDVDVVSFVRAPILTDQVAPEAETALDHHAAKERFRVDGYFVELDLLSREQLVEQATYWYGLWSHRRSQCWKGFVRVDLAPTHDELAAVALREAVARLAP